MKFLNEYDIETAYNRLDESITPNRWRVLVTVANLAEWANRNSDGWAYWPKPLRAAQAAIALVESRTSRENDLQEREDATAAETAKALASIKRFCAAQSIPHAEIIAPA